jgi:hypothetical protein
MNKLLGAPPFPRLVREGGDVDLPFLEAEPKDDDSPR